MNHHQPSSTITIKHNLTQEDEAPIPFNTSSIAMLHNKVGAVLERMKPRLERHKAGVGWGGQWVHVGVSRNMVWWIELCRMDA